MAAVAATATAVIQFCERHALRIIDLVEDRGLGPLRCLTRETFRIKAEDQAARGTTRETFEPVLHATLMIVHNAYEMGGVILFAGDTAGRPRCPLCFCVDIGGPEMEGWAERAADSSLMAAARLGHDVLGMNRVRLLSILASKVAKGGDAWGAGTW